MAIIHRAKCKESSEFESSDLHHVSAWINLEPFTKEYVKLNKSPCDLTGNRRRLNGSQDPPLVW